MIFNNLNDVKCEGKNSNFSCSKHEDNCCTRKDRKDNCWVVHNNFPNIVNAFQVQLQGSSGEVIADGANVIYGTTILNATTNNAITYDSSTGVFTINERGVYYVSWWTNADGAEESTNIIFAAESGATSIAASSVTPLITLQLNGQALFNITTTPATLSLVNRTGTSVSLGTSSVQADLIIIKL
ncbi:MAG: hypothetical protein PHS54_06835 [Clostridia bacterium]|nr:hypothetical protein [Clostridia bacterium]